MKCKIVFFLCCVLSLNVMAKGKGGFQNFMNGLNAVNQALQQQTNANKTVVGYDTLYQTVKKRVLVDTKYTEEGGSSYMKEFPVHSNSVTGNPKRFQTVKIPKSVVNGMTEKKVVAISYWVSVDQEASQKMKNMALSLANAGVKTYMTMNGLGAFAGMSDAVVSAKKGSKEDIYFKVVKSETEAQKWFENEKGSYAVGMQPIYSDSDLIQDLENKDTVCFCFFNNNLYFKVNVAIAYSFIYEINTYEEQLFREIMDVRPIYQ